MSRIHIDNKSLLVIVLVQTVGWQMIGDYPLISKVLLGATILVLWMVYWVSRHE